MDFFLIKKLVSLFLHLVPGILLLILALLLLCQSRFCRPFATPIAFAATFTLLLASTPFVSNKLVDSLENRFPVMNAPPADTRLFLILGNYANNNVTRPPNLQLSAAALSRVTEAIRLWRQQPSASLYFGGPSRLAMRDFAVANGVPVDQITLNHAVRDTIDELEAAMKFPTSTVADGRTVVVSSATHLTRARLIVDNAAALGLTNSAGRPHSYAPADFIAAPSDRLIHASSNYLHKTDRVVHEYVGMLWVKLKLLIRSMQPA